MILWKGKVSRDDEPPPWNKGDHRSWRWVLEARPTSLDLSHQYKMRDSDEFHHGVSGYFNATLTRHFKLGGDHSWYDGPHCGFSFGFVHFNWSWWNCKKCEGSK